MRAAVSAPAAKSRLEAYGFVERTVHPSVPLHVEYALTDLGRGVAKPLRALRRRVEDNMDAIDEAQTAS